MGDRIMGVVIQLTRGDQSVPVDFSLTDQNDTAVDLSNTSAKFKMAPQGSMIGTVNAGMVNQSAAGGIVRYSFLQSDLANAGTYTAEIEVNYVAGNASGRIISTKEGDITVIIGGQRPQ